MRWGGEMPLGMAVADGRSLPLSRLAETRIVTLSIRVAMRVRRPPFAIEFVPRTAATRARSERLACVVEDALVLLPPQQRLPV